MTLGLVGDLFMARLLSVAQYVLLGMGAFGLGHVAYIAAGLVYGNQHGFGRDRHALQRMGCLAGGGLDRLVPGRIPGSAKAFRVLHWVSTALRAPARQHRWGRDRPRSPGPALWPMAVGAALFLLSDLILAARLFNGHSFPLIEDAIWLTYGPGQMLIVYSVGSALGALAAQ